MRRAQGKCIEEGIVHLQIVNHFSGLRVHVLIEGAGVASFSDEPRDRCRNNQARRVDDNCRRLREYISTQQV